MNGQTARQHSAKAFRHADGPLARDQTLRQPRAMRLGAHAPDERLELYQGSHVHLNQMHGPTTE
jgi:hypothetical protein